jgi:hypothetical protein
MFEDRDRDTTITLRRASQQKEIAAPARRGHPDFSAKLEAVLLA